MKVQRRAMLLGLAALGLAACTSTPKPALFHIQDSKVDLRSYRTFAFRAPAGAAVRSIIDRRLLEAARGELERRGYMFDEQSAELLVDVGVVVEGRQALRSVPGRFPGWDGIETEDYRLGRLAIDLIDARRNEAVWRGIAEGRVSDAMLRDGGGAAEKAVATVFEGFPVPPNARAAAPTAPMAR
ncbi:DUF4136 domain-containing protein [Caldimonas sp. KR1-144]|uniref:DUF4136 domain-containing protein n=1 Tax=Caldimonas sp. KR1-144 TaxID=3400911 RepID=UPI003C0485D4